MKRLSILLVLCVSFEILAQTGPGLKFIENKNQWPSEIDFGARIPGGNMMVSPGKFSYFFIDKQKLQEVHDQRHHLIDRPETAHEEYINAHTVEVTLVGANLLSEPLPFGRSSEYYNFFVGSDKSHWGSGAYGYNGAIYPSIYQGINLKIYSKGNNMKYDFVVAPGADPTQILLDYNGADKLSLDNGNLVINTSLGDMIERRPFAFQYITGRRVEVPAQYTLVGNKMSFAFPFGYDACYELVIDPLLIFSTYSGSTADNWGSSATPGENGNLYSAGVTNQFKYFFNTANNSIDSIRSGDFPATIGAFQRSYGGVYDVGILKYDSTGEHLLYASYLGGANTDSPHSLLMNKQGELLVLGTTTSRDFPTTAGAFDEDFNGGRAVEPIGVPYNNGSDLFITKISKNGTQILASTFLGGSKNDGLNAYRTALWQNYGDEMRGDILTDDVGNIYVASVTESADFPMTNSFDVVYNNDGIDSDNNHLSDAIVVKMSADLKEMKWGAFVGGSNADAAHSIKLDSEGNLFVAGGTASNDFPKTAGSFQPLDSAGVDGWIAKIANDGSSIVQATYVGTPGFDQVYFVDLNSDGEVYVYGQTNGVMPMDPGYYGTPGGQFLQKFSNDLKSRIYSTTFGNGTDPNISPTAFLVSDCNSIYMTGWGGVLNQVVGAWNTSTDGLETTSDAYDNTTSGSDFYLIVLGEDAKELTYATYLGGNKSRTHVDGGTSRFDKEGVVYHAVCSGCVSRNADREATSDFPTTETAWSRTNNSENCNNAAFKFDLASLKARLTIDGGIATICLPDKFKFNNLSSGGIIYHWDLGDGTKTSRSDHVSLEHEYESPGVYDVKLVAYDPATCIVSDTASVKVFVFEPAAEVQTDDDLCGGTSYKLKASGGASYHWYTEDGSFESNEESPEVIPHDTTLYYVDVVEASGCVHTEEVLLKVIPAINPDFEIEREAGCTTRPVIVVNSLTDSLMVDDQLTFDFGDGTASNELNVEHFYDNDSIYIVRQLAVRGPCTFQKAVQVPVFTMTVPNIITPAVIDSKNDVFTVQFGKIEDDIVLTPKDYGFNVSIKVFNRWGDLVYSNPEYNYDWSAEDQAPGVYFYEVKVEGHTTCKSWVQVVK